MGSGENGEWTFLDILAVMGFCIGLQNLELNIGQDDMQKQTQDINKAADELVKNALAEIHSHLEMQDEKIERILKYYEDNKET